jgi:1-deoxy-D-xylulose-5-phosphate reductoisomerase
VRAGGTTPAILNAANEVAVNAFLERRIGFLDIPRVIAGVLDSVSPHPETEIEAILDDDRAARLAAGHIAHPQSPTARSSQA